MVYGLNSIPIREHLRYANDKLLIVSFFSFVLHFVKRRLLPLYRVGCFVHCCLLYQIRCAIIVFTVKLCKISQLVLYSQRSTKLLFQNLAFGVAYLVEKKEPPFHLELHEGKFLYSVFDTDSVTVFFQ